jgi:hypothetical protein
MKTYLLVRVHAGEATAVAGLATLGSDSLDFLLGAGEGVSDVLQSWTVGNRIAYRLAKLPGLSFPWSDMLIGLCVIERFESSKIG